MSFLSLRIAFEFNLPVLIHNDIGAIGDHRPKYVREIRACCGVEPATKVIWAHCGVNRGVSVHRHTDVLRGLLAEFDNLEVNLSWQVLWDPELFDPKIKCLNADWQSLVDDNSFQFVIGTEGVGSKGVRSYADTIECTRSILSMLSPDVAKLVGCDNMLRLLWARVLETEANESGEVAEVERGKDLLHEEARIDLIPRNQLRPELIGRVRLEVAQMTPVSC